MINRLRLICIITVSAGSTACSSVFYQPTHFEYADPAKLTPVPEQVEFTSEDGTRLHGWWFHADHPKGTIVHFHGNAQNLSAHFRFLRHAVVAGYDHFIFDYRGYGKSAGKPEPLGVVADGRAALRLARTRVPSSPLIVVGQSLGGAIALRTLTDLNGEVPVRLLVVDSTFMNYRSEARRVLAQMWLTWPLQPIAWAVVDNSGAPPADLSRVKVGRAIVIHGRADRTVPYVMGQRVFAALPEPKEMWEVPDGGHTDFLWRLDFEKRFFEALDQASG